MKFWCQKLQSWNIPKESWSICFCTKKVRIKCWWNWHLVSSVKKRVFLNEIQNNISFLSDKSIDDNSVKFQQTERQTIGPSFETPIIQLESRVGGNSSDLDLERKLNTNETAALAQDIYDGKVVIPTFEEFLVYILSTDLQGTNTKKIDPVTLRILFFLMK